MKRTVFYGKIKKETDKAILIDGVWVSKSVVAEKIEVEAENVGDGFGFESVKNHYYIKTKFPLTVSGWLGGYFEAKLVDGRIVQIPN